MNDQERERLNLATRLAEKAEAEVWRSKGLEVMGVSPLPGMGTYVPDAQGPAIRTDIPPVPEP